MFDQGPSPQHQGMTGQPTGLALLEAHRRDLFDREISRPEPCRVHRARGVPTAPVQVEVLVEAVRRTHAVDVGGLDADDAKAVLVHLERARRGLDAAIASAVATIDRLGTVEAEEGLRATTWAARATRGSRSVWSRDRRLGRLLVDFEAFARALARGSIGIEHVEVLSAVLNPRNAASLAQPKVQARLLVIAHHCSFGTYRSAVRAAAESADPDGAEPKHGAGPSAAVASDHLGDVHLRARFTGADAAVVLEAIDAETLSQHRAATREEKLIGVPVPTAEELRARAVAELIRRGAAADPQRLLTPRTEAIVVFDADEQRLPTRVVDGQALDATTAATLACGAEHRAVLLGVHGEAIWVGRGHRYAPAPLRAALTARDAGCTFPGCDAPPGWCDAHHVIPWEAGGPTQPDNCVLLCRRHHGLAHSRRWDLRAETPPGKRSSSYSPPRFVWTTPTGARAQSQHRTRGVGVVHRRDE